MTLDFPPTNSENDSHYISPYLAKTSNQYLGDRKALYWARFDYWRLWEAILLAVGLCPTYFQRLERHEMKLRSPISESEAFAALSMRPLEIAAEYFSPRPDSNKFQDWWCVYDVLSRCDQFRDDKVEPTTFIAWVKSKKFVVPRALEQAILEVNGPLPVWGYEQCYHLNDADQPELTWDGPKWVKSTPINNSDYERDIRCEDQDEQAENREAAEGIKPKERESLLKMILGMAMEQYAHDPYAARTETAKNIEYDLIGHDLRLDQDTVRKYLNEAKERFLPNEPE